MGRLILVLIVIALVAGLWARSAMAEKRRRKLVQTELDKNPERPQPTLDPTDDA